VISAPPVIARINDQRSFLTWWNPPIVPEFLRWGATQVFVAFSKHGRLPLQVIVEHGSHVKLSHDKLFQIYRLNGIGGNLLQDINKAAGGLISYVFILFHPPSFWTLFWCQKICVFRHSQTPYSVRERLRFAGLRFLSLIFFLLSALLRLGSAFTGCNLALKLILDHRVLFIILVHTRSIFKWCGDSNLVRFFFPLLCFLVWRRQSFFSSPVSCSMKLAVDCLSRLLVFHLDRYF